MSNPDNSTDDQRTLLLRKPQVCLMLSCGETYLDGLIEAGEVEIVRDGPKFVRIVAASVHALVERRKQRGSQG